MCSQNGVGMKSQGWRRNERALAYVRQCREDESWGTYVSKREQGSVKEEHYPQEHEECAECRKGDTNLCISVAANQ